VSATNTFQRNWRLSAVVVLIAATVGLAVWWVVVQINSMSKPLKHGVQEIALVKPPPPPPPPPPKEQMPKQEQQKMDVPDQQTPKDAPPDKPDVPPPGPDLGVDANGSGAGDSFNLLGKKGGAGLIGSSGGGNRFAWYGALIRDRIQEALQKDKKVRQASDLRVMVNVWVNAGGGITRVDLLTGSGDADMDSAIKQVLKALPALREGAPPDMPQPVKLKITAR